MLAVVCRNGPEPTPSSDRRRAAALAAHGVPLVRVALRRARAEPGGGGAPASGAVDTPFVGEQGGSAWRGFLGAPARASAGLARLVAGARPGDGEGGLLGAFGAWRDGLRLASWARARDVTAWHAQSAGRGASAAWVAARATGRPFSFEVDHPYAFVVGRSLLRAKARAARVVTAGSGVARDRVLALAPDATVRVVRRGVDAEGAAARARGARAAKRYDVVAVGSLVPRKGHEVLVDAVARLAKRRPGLAAAIAGTGPLRASLERRARDAGAKVDFLGGISEDAALGLVASARVFALPCVVADDGDEDGIPVALVEAMALRVPVASTPVGGIPELLEDGRAGELVPERDAASLATAVERLLDDEALRRERVAAGLAAVAARHDLASCAASLAAALGQAPDPSVTAATRT